MKGRGYKQTVSSSYVSYLRTLLSKLYTGGYTVIPNAEELLNRAVKYPTLIKGLLEYFDDVIKKAFSDANCPIPRKQLDNGRSAFRKFVEFILWCLSPANVTVQGVKQMVFNQTAVFTKPTKLYQSMMGWDTYTQNKIVGIIKKRLGTQDRDTGIKVWLPMRVIKKLLGPVWFDNWCKGIIAETKVLIDDQGVCKKLNQVDKLVLKPDSSAKNSVWVVVDGQEYRVFTNTRKGTINPMLVNGMEKVSLEHAKPIDQTLRDLYNKKVLPELSKVSDIAKQVSLRIGNHDGNKIDKEITVQNNHLSSDITSTSCDVDTDELLREMDLIREDTDYELMDSAQNSKKGNRPSKN